MAALPVLLPATKVASHSSSSSASSGCRDNVPRLSRTRLFCAYFGAAMTLFLATTDATIVSTSLPKIASDLRATSSEYTWIGVSYLLTQTSCQPLYGRISDLLGRKLVLYISMLIFTVGSLLCGLARTSSWLIAARGVAGIGGGGIVSCVWSLTSELVEEQERAKWSQVLSITWSASAVAGPLLGGVFSGSAPSGSLLSWRWAFYMNLPVCLAAFVMLALSLRGVEVGFDPNATFRQFIQRFDFLGLVLLMGGSAALLLGLSFAGDRGWTSPFTLANICVGAGILICACIYESITTRDPLLPSTLFTNLTTSSILLVSFLHNVFFNAGTFYLTVFFQIVMNCTPFEAGVRTLPYTLGSSLATVPSAWIITYVQKRTETTIGQLFITRTGLFVSTVGFALMTLMDERAQLWVQILYPMVAGIGIGMLFHAPYQIFLYALDRSQVAIATSSLFLCRFTGATLGLALAGMVFQNNLSGRLPDGIPGIQIEHALDLSTLDRLPDSVRLIISHDLAMSIRAIWVFCAPTSGAAFLVALLARKYSCQNRSLPTSSSTETQEKV